MPVPLNSIIFGRRVRSHSHSHSCIVLSHSNTHTHSFIYTIYTCRISDKCTLNHMHLNVVCIFRLCSNYVSSQNTHNKTENTDTNVKKKEGERERKTESKINEIFCIAHRVREREWKSCNVCVRIECFIFCTKIHELTTHARVYIYISVDTVTYLHAYKTPKDPHRV